METFVQPVASLVTLLVAFSVTASCCYITLLHDEMELQNTLEIAQSSDRTALHKGKEQKIMHTLKSTKQSIKPTRADAYAGHSLLPHSLLFVGAATVVLLMALLLTTGPALAADADAMNQHIYVPLAGKDFTGTSGTKEPQEPTPTETATAEPTATATAEPTATATSEPTPTVTATPEPSKDEGAFFAERQFKTNSASIQVDKNGGLHLAYTSYESQASGKPIGAFYAYCATDCAIEANWQRVQFAADPTEIQLELTPAGKPRILIRAYNSQGKDYIYGECDQNCTVNGNWKLVTVITTQGTEVSDIFDGNISQRYFELDPQGRPRFIFHNRNYSVEPDLYGGYYAFCDAECSKLESWDATTRITKEVMGEWLEKWEELGYPALAFTPDGKPRIVAELTPLDAETTGFYYFECNSACNKPDSWERFRLDDRGQGSELGWDIEVDAQGGVHVAFYPAQLESGNGQQLFYVWCAATCLQDSSWGGMNIGLGKENGQDPELELDAQGNPHFAFFVDSTNGISYVWCDGNCHEGGEQWHYKSIESHESLYTSWPVPYPFSCDGGFWLSHTPSMALNTQGKPFFAFDATYHARCWYDDVHDNYEPSSRINLIQRAVRLNFLPLPE
jgi:hypothetical protein